MIRRSALAFYISIVFYVLFIFFTQWSLVAAKMNEAWLSSILSSSVNFIILPSILVLAAYSIAINFTYYARHKWFSVACMAMLLFVAVISKSISFTLPLLLGFVGFSASNRKTAKVALFSFIVLLITSYLFSLLGFTGGDTISKPLFGVDNTDAMTVTALGMANPNAVMLIFFNVIALLLFLSKTKRQDFFVFVMLLILTIILSVATGSTTGVVIGIVTIVLVLCAKHIKTVFKCFQKITPWMFLFMTILTFAISVNFGSFENKDNDVNSALTGRPQLWNLRIENNSYINLIGNNDQYQISKTVGSNEPTHALDNALLYILVHFGVIAYLIFWYVFYSGSKKTRDPVLIAYILAATLLMFMEKMELYGLALLFLQKTIVGDHLLNERKVRKI